MRLEINRNKTNPKPKYMTTIDINPSTETQLNKLTAIDAQHAASNRSSKYGFISSRSIIESLTDEGFSIRKVDIQRTKDPIKLGFQRHFVRMRHSDLLPQVGDYFPEVLVMNSHDGSSKFRMTLGIFRLVCSNGMVSGSSHDEIAFSHRQISLEAIHNGVHQLISGAGRLREQVSKMGSRQLTITEINEFATNALRLRYDKPVEQEAETREQYFRESARWNNRLATTLNTRRAEDAQNSLWNVYNRIQENLTQGAGRGSGIRRITAPLADIEINRNLWNLAEAYLN
jgi:hypothetical protein